MSGREPGVEALIRGRLESRGWLVTSETRRGTDVDWEVEREGTTARVRLRCPYVEPPVVSYSDLPPAFVRIDRGTSDDRLERWSVASAESEREEDRDVGHQAVAGVDWASVAVGVGTSTSRERWRAAIDDALAAIDRSRDGRSGTTHPVRVQPDPRDGFPWWVSLSKWGGAGLLTVLVTAPIWMVDGEARAGVPLVPGIVAGVIAAGLAIATVRRWARRRATRVDAPLAVAGLRSWSSVIAVDDRAEPCGRVAVVTRTGSEPGLGHLEIRRRVLKARLKPAGSSLTLSIWSCLYPNGTSAECRLLPEWTAVLSIEAPAAILARLPPGSRPARDGEGATWLVFDDAALSQLLERVASVLREAIPYR